MCGRKLRLMWHFRNDYREFINTNLTQKSTLRIEMYLSHLEAKMLPLNEKISYSNLTNGGRNSLHLLRDDPSIIIKEADKESVVVVWTKRTI